LQASLYDVNALMDQAKQYNSDTKIALEIATLSVSYRCRQCSAWRYCLVVADAIWELNAAAAGLLQHLWRP
jgi:hypothetical protein